MRHVANNSPNFINERLLHLSNVGLNVDALETVFPSMIIYAMIIYAVDYADSIYASEKIVYKAQFLSFIFNDVLGARLTFLPVEREISIWLS